MPDKRAPVGICDQCGGPIPAGEWYTSKGKERLHCSPECKATANSRAGAPIRSRKAKAKVAAGEWYNPRSGMTPEQISAVQSRASRTARLAEVTDGRWRNPALDDAARAKLSRPRKHTGVLHQAIKKLGQDYSVSDLTTEEQAAHRDYRRELRLARLDQARQYRRAYDRRRWEQKTPEEREAQRARWRRQNKQRARLKRQNKKATPK
jgi:hypothetical protein